jgi:hypothetical protein
MTNNRIETDSNIVGAIQDLSAEMGYNPSFREVAERTCLPLGTLHELCRLLREEGSVFFVDGVARSLRISG